MFWLKRKKSEPPAPAPPCEHEYVKKGETERELSRNREFMRMRSLKVNLCVHCGDRVALEGGEWGSWVFRPRRGA
jgi:hypothetical protein